MKPARISRRKFIAAALLAAPAVAGADAEWLEPEWLKVEHVRLGEGPPQHRFAHFSDLHHKGDREYLQRVVDRINLLAPDFVCFTGDIVETPKYLPEALEYLGRIKAPLFGVPGNHDFRSGISFGPVREIFAATGGAWLVDQPQRVAGTEVNLWGLSCLFGNQRPLPTDPALKNIVLMHYPAWVEKFGGQKFDLLLAGHSHGGQVRLPFIGSLIVPYFVDQYDLGLFQTAAGPLYVNPGIGYISHYNFRFNCRPEITVIEI